MTKVNGISLSLIATATFLNVANADSTYLGEISVTATKTERKISDVPVSVSVIGKEEIQSSAAESVDQLLQEVAGVDVVHNTGVLSSGSRSKVVLRGVGGTGESRVLLLIDGVPMNSALSGSVEWNLISLDTVERVEVLKGANSALYGSNAMGGVVNIITKKGEGAQTDLSLSFGSMNTKIGSFSTSGKIDKFGYLLSGQFTQSDGYVTELQEDIQDNTIPTGLERKNMFLKFSYDIDDSSTLSTSYNYYNNTILGELEIPEGYNPGIDTIEMLQISYNKIFENESEVKLTLFDKSNRSKNDYLKDSKTLEYYNSSSSDESGATLQYTYPLDTHIVTAGFDFQAADVQSNNDYPGGEVVTSKGNQDYYALFVQDEIFLGEDIIINIGGRFDTYTNDKGEVYDEKTGTYVRYPSRSFDAFSPKLALLYRPFATTALRTSLGQSFRAPSVNDLYKNTIKKGKISAGNPNLEPETITSIEVGIDQKIWDTGLLSITGYHSRIKDYIYSLIAPASSPYYKEKINVGEAKIIGVESELRHKFSSFWSGFVNYTYTDATIEKFEKDTNLEGKEIIRIPKNKASAGLYYKNPTLFDVKVNVRYVGERYEDDKNSVEYESYITCDFALSKNVNEQFKLSLKVEDLFDEAYEEKYASPGRVIMANVNFKF